MFGFGGGGAGLWWGGGGTVRVGGVRKRLERWEGDLRILGCCHCDDRSSRGSLSRVV